MSDSVGDQTDFFKIVPITSCLKRVSQIYIEVSEEVDTISIG